MWKWRNWHHDTKTEMSLLVIDIESAGILDNLYLNMSPKPKKWFQMYKKSKKQQHKNEPCLVLNLNFSGE